MDLNAFESFCKIDQEDMYSQIHNLPDQILTAWEIGQSRVLPEMRGLQNIVVAGMGGSAIGADLLAAYISAESLIPVIVNREYDLPAWAQGSETLVIASSHSGNTEETLYAYENAKRNQCRIMTICTGGKLAELAKSDNLPVWRFEHSGQPRAAVGFSFGFLLAAIRKLGLIKDPRDDIDEAVNEMCAQQKTLAANIPLAENPAKQLATKLFAKLVVIIGTDYLSPVSRRWKGQVSEISKAWSQFELLPEADHNTLAGLVNPGDIFPNMVTVFLQASSIHPRNRIRLELTREKFESQGISTKEYMAKGESRLSHIWSALHFGDYVSYYLAMMYEVDPTPVVVLEQLKQAMKGR